MTRLQFWLNSERLHRVSRSLCAMAIGLVVIISTTAIAAPVRQILRLGAQGSDVTELQSTLKLLGYFSGSVDGVFGESTDQAVKQFQQVAGLEADGVVGTATWDRLFPSSGPIAAMPAPRSTPTSAPRSEPVTPSGFPILRRGATGEAVRGLQSRLRAIGVYNGEVDGVFGAGTETAVKVAQQKFRLEPDGVVGGATWTAILR